MPGTLTWEQAQPKTLSWEDAQPAVPISDKEVDEVARPQMEDQAASEQMNQNTGLVTALAGDAPEIGKKVLNAAYRVAKPMVDAVNLPKKAMDAFLPSLDQKKPLLDWVAKPGEDYKAHHPIAGGIIDWAQNASAAMSTPEILSQLVPLLGSEGVAKVVSATFLSQMAADAPEQAADFGKKLGQGDIPGATSALLNYAAGVAAPAIGAKLTLPEALTKGDATRLLSKQLRGAMEKQPSFQTQSITRNMPPEKMGNVSTEPVAPPDVNFQMKQAIPPKSTSRPVVPATPSEAEKNETVLREIRRRNLDTKAKVQAAFHQSQLTREQAGALIKAASILPQATAEAAKTIVEKGKENATNPQQVQEGVQPERKTGDEGGEAAKTGGGDSLQRATPVESPVATPAPAPESAAPAKPEIPLKPQQLVPAIKQEDGSLIVGKPGQKHVDVIADSVQQGVLANGERGFVDANNPKVFLTREQAAKATGATGELHTQDLPQTKPAEGAAASPQPAVSEAENTAFESTHSLVARTNVGDERDAAFTRRAKALKTVALSLKKGDVIIDEDGERRVVASVDKDGTLWVHREGATGTEQTGFEFHLEPGSSIERLNESDKYSKSIPGVREGVPRKVDESKIQQTSRSKPSALPVEVVGTGQTQTSIAAGRQAGSKGLGPVSEAKAKTQFQSLDEIDASKLTPAQKIKAAAKLRKAQGVKATPEELSKPAISRGPGAAAAGEPGTYSNIQQLTDQIKAHVPNASVGDKIGFLDKIKAKAASFADDVKQTFAKAVAVKDMLVNGYLDQPEFTDYKRIKGKWDYGLQKADDQSRSFLKTVRKSVPSKLRQEAITNWIQADGDESVLRQRADASSLAHRAGYEAALNLTDQEKSLASMIRDYFDRQLELGQQEGILKNGLEDYVNQVWKKDSPIKSKLMSELIGGKLQPNFKFSRKRIFDSFFEGEQTGHKPASKAIGDLLAHYDQTFNKSIAAREFLRNLRDQNGSDGRPLAEVSGYGKPVEGEKGVEKYIVKPRVLGDKLQGYRTIDHPALRGWKWAATTEGGKPIMFEGPLVVHPEIYQDLKNVLSTSAWRQNPIAKTALEIQSGLKQTMLSFAGFHQVQETVHALGHMVNPAKLPDLDVEEPVTKSLMEHGLQVANFNAMQEFEEGVSGGGLAKYLPVVGKTLHEYTQFLFQDYIPRLKVQMAKLALERNRERYAKDLKDGKINEDQLLALTARQANAAFGEQNYRMMGRNPNLQDALNVFLFAPDFFESRARFVSQALKPYGREQLAAIGKIAATMYIGARIANQALNNDPHWEPRNAFSVVYKNHRYSLRSIPGDLLRMFTDPRSFWANRVGVGMRLAMEALTGRDDRGVKRSAVQMLKDAAQTLVPLGLRKRDDQNLIEAFANSFGVQTQRDNPEEQVREKINDWKKQNGIKEGPMEEIYDADADDYRPLRLALESDNADKARKAFVALSKKIPRDKIEKSIKAHYTRPMTGSKMHEKDFVHSLSEGEKAEYSNAQKDRMRQLRLFYQASR